MKKKIFLIGVLLTIFILITVLVLTNNTSNFDDNIYNIVYSLRSNFFDFFFKSITICANTLTIICLVILLLLIIKDKFRYVLGISVISSVLSNQLLKHIFMRPRPDHIRLIKQGGYSYPSGHSMISIAVYGILTLTFQNCQKTFWVNNRDKISLILNVAAVFLFIISSQPYAGVFLFIFLAIKASMLIKWQ